VDADLRRFYGMSWNEALDSVPAPDFFGLVIRLVHYGGAVTALARSEAGEAGKERETVEFDPTDPMFAGVID